LNKDVVSTVSRLKNKLIILKSLGASKPKNLSRIAKYATLAQNGLPMY